jgi:hypothetical protein
MREVFNVVDLTRLLSAIEERTGRSNVVDLAFERERRAVERSVPHARHRPRTGPDRERHGPD